MAKHIEMQSLRRAVPLGSLSAGVALAVAALGPTKALAQGGSGTAAGTGGDPSIDLETVVVEGADGDAAGDTSGGTNTLKARTGTGRLDGTVQDTPRTVTVITEKQMDEQGATTLERALQNVPGVTVRIGEGNGGLNGDQFMIRGFEAKGDIYSDGLRDFGVYVRDSFVYEGISVFKGPTSEGFGMGTTGGAINITTKAARRGSFYDAEATIGEDLRKRLTFDINHEINETTAIRFAGMWTSEGDEVFDRDHVESDRWGFLASIGFGLETETEWKLTYVFQHNDRVPDYGIPIVTPAFGDVATYGSLGQPMSEFGLDPSTFYGKETDKDVTDTHILTSIFKADVNDWLTVHNDTRLAFYTREFATSVASCGTGATLAAYETSCTGQFFNGADLPLITFGGGNPAYEQDSWGIQNITTFTGEFETGFLRHRYAAGIDAFYQDNVRDQFSTVGSKPAQNIFSPNFYNTTGYALVDSGFNRDGDATDVAFFVNDRVWLTDTISILAGTRWDRYEANYINTQTMTAETNAVTEFWSPKASLIWEPTPNQTYYASWSTSKTPAGLYVTNASNNLDATQNNLEPEENENWEIGGKISVFDGRLGLSAALYRVDKSNQTYTDASGDVVATGDEVRGQGIEIGVAGMITDAWTVSLAYAYNDSEVLYSATTANIGNRVAFAPENSASLWTTYEISKHMQGMIPGKLVVGGGITYRDEVFTNNNNLTIAPETFSLDGLLSYEVENYRFAVNGYNLTDELNYAGVWGNRVVPAAGRTVTFTVGAKF